MFFINLEPLKYEFDNTEAKTPFKITKSIIKKLITY